MPTTFIISDTHFGHEKTCTVFKQEDGSPLRPFSSAEEMDEVMIQRWNDKVRPKDKVYHLGDVVISRKSLHILSRLNGDKVLIKGNHDIFKLSDYAEYFRDIRAYHILNGMIFSHIPVHEDSLARFGCNIHGHLHANRVLLEEPGKLGRFNIDPRYFCACVEHTDYAPISLEEIADRIRAQGGHVGFKNDSGLISIM